MEVRAEISSNYSLEHIYIQPLRIIEGGAIPWSPVTTAQGMYGLAANLLSKRVKYLIFCES